MSRVCAVHVLRARPVCCAVLAANTHTCFSVGAAGAVVESAGALVEGLVVAMVPGSARNTG